MENIIKAIQEKKATVIDVRSQMEFDTEHFPGALHIPLETVGDEAAKIAVDSVKEFIEIACEFAGLDFKWHETDNEMETKLLVNDKVIMEISEKYYRPAEVDLLYGDSIETRKLINWEPKVTFRQLVKKMIDNDIKLLE